MAGNSNLHNAASAKKDEFYTQRTDIENELYHYREYFKGKTVLCNCDDPYESNFFKYFAMSFNALGLKKLIATCYKGSPIAYTELSLFPELVPEVKEIRPPYKAVITEVSDYNGDGAVDLADVEWLLQNKKNSCELLKGDGDFRSDECIELLKEADIVVTNPPFSLFREYVALLEKYNKKFVIIGNKNAITYKEIFPLIAQNKIWIGVTPMSKEIYFNVPQSYIDEGIEKKKDRSIVKVNGKYVARSQSIWYTNLDNKKRHGDIPLWKTYSPEAYPKYDNYDAIEVSKASDIPCDYDGVMGVPITFLDKFNPNQFEIIGITNHGDMAGIPYKNGNCFAEIKGKRMYVRIFIRRKMQGGN